MGKLLVRQWNTYFAEMRVPKALQHLFVHGEDKPAHLRGKPVVKFTKSLETDSHELAEIRKLPIIANWKAMIAAARQTVSPKQFDYDKAVKSYSETFKALGSGPDAITHVSHQVPLNDADTVEDMAKINEEQPKIRDYEPNADTFSIYGNDCIKLPSRSFKIWILRF